MSIFANAVLTLLCAVDVRSLTSCFYKVPDFQALCVELDSNLQALRSVYHMAELII